jgi:hypothetical protein
LNFWILFSYFTATLQMQKKRALKNIVVRNQIPKLERRNNSRLQTLRKRPWVFLIILALWIAETLSRPLALA